MVENLFKHTLILSLLLIHNRVMGVGTYPSYYRARGRANTQRQPLTVFIFLIKR